MTWKSHIAVTGAGAYAATLNPAFAAIAAAGSVLPDRIELIAPFLKHRGNSHALTLWTGAAIASAIAASLHPELWPAFALLVGGLAHTLEDMCSVSGVPLLPGTNVKKSSNIIKIPLYKTGQPSEFVVTILLLILFGGILALRGQLPIANT
jgi:membrane-bound metal-dependent hydrolase YbcI (DUF457 family)